MILRILENANKSMESLTCLFIPNILFRPLLRNIEFGSKLYLNVWLALGRVSIAICFFSTSIYSQSLYLGAKSTYTDWQVGTVNSLNRTTNLMSGINSASGLFNAVDTQARKDNTYFNIERKTTRMYLGGISASYITDKWSINYFGTYGSSNFHVKETTGGFSSGYYHDFPPNSTGVEEQAFVGNQNINVRRYDHDFSFSRLLGNTPIFIFTGLKSQSYNYSGTTGLKPQYDKIYIIERDEFTYPAKFQETYFSFNSNFRGPAFGLGYSLPITDKQGLTFSAGLVYLEGYLTSRINYVMVKSQQFSYFTNNGIDIATFDLREKIASKGYTAEITYVNRVLENFLIRIHLFQQATTYTTLNIDHSFYYLTFNSNNSYVNAFGIPIDRLFDKNGIQNSGYNKAKDIFNGISFSVLYRLDFL